MSFRCNQLPDNQDEECRCNLELSHNGEHRWDDPDLCWFCQRRPAAAIRNSPTRGVNSRCVPCDAVLDLIY